MHITAAADRQHALAVQRPGQVAAVALSAAGAAGHDAGGRDDLGLCLTAARAGEGLHTGLGFRRLLRHFAVVPCVAERIHVSIHVAVTTGAGVGRVALFRAGRRRDNILIAVHMRNHRHSLRPGLAAAGAGEGLHTGLGFRRLLRHFAVVPCVTQSVHISVHVAVAAGASVRRVALFRAGRSGDNSLVAVGMGNIIVMDVGGQKVIISIGRNRDRFPLRLAPGIVHIGQRCAVTESLTFNARHAAWDRHAGQRCATFESITANARHAVRDRHARQRCATLESMLANARHAVRDRHAGQRCAIIESLLSNARHAVRDRICRKSARALHQSCLIFAEQNTGCIAGVMTVALSDPYTGQRCTRSESAIANARHAVRDRHARQRCAIIESSSTNARHAVWDRHAGQRCTRSESVTTNARHAVRDRHARQRFATLESTIVNERHAVRDRHACKRFAIRESSTTNARHAVRNRHACKRFAIRESTISNARHAFCNHS